MMKFFLNRQALYVTITLLCFIHKSFGQADFSIIKNQFDHYRQTVLQEKIYVHTDKTIYLAGEILWFKIYNVDASLHQFLDISKVVYVEVLGKDHTPVMQTKLSLKEGLGNGSFVLPLELNSGNYTFRAYTNWMKNFDPEFFFEKTITVINTIKSEPVNTAANVKNIYDVQFFPEGGNLVSGVESTVGFRAVDQYGHSYDLNGTVLNNNDDTILNFQSSKFGIGNFRFTPASGTTYKATITFANGDVVIKDMPKPFSEGYVIY